MKLLGKEDASELLGVQLTDGLRMVAYETDNRITNTGTDAWEPRSGLLSIWILGMYNPSPETTVVIPFQAGDEKALGPIVNDSYFGKVPEEYLKVEKERLFFRGDGNHSQTGEKKQLRLTATSPIDFAFASREDRSNGTGIASQKP